MTTALEPAQGWAQRVFHASAAWQCVLTRSGDILAMNAGFQSAFGAAQRWGALRGALEEASPGLAGLVACLVEHGQGFYVDDLTVRSGGLGQRRVTGEGVVLEGGGERCITLMDMTQRVTVETARAQRERSESLSRFAGGFAQDLEELMQSVMEEAQSALGALGSRSVAPGPRLVAILAAAERARTLSNILRAMAYEETGSWRPVDLAGEVRAAAALIGAGSSAVPMLLDLRAPGAEVVGERVRLHQLVLNLLLNAHDASRERGGGVEVSLFDTPEGGVCLRVADEGQGVAEELRERIFEPYFTTKRGHSAPGDWGSGLGLAVVDAVARSTGATVSVGSRPTGGAVFEVQWPVTSVVRDERASLRPPEPSVAGCGVLLVGAEPALLAALARGLRRRGHSVFVALSATEGRRLLTECQRTIQVVLIDRELGDERVEALLGDVSKHAPGVGVVAIGSRPATEGLASSAIGEQLLKPFELSQLIAAIEGLRAKASPAPAEPPA